jgi:hypothetical protein
MNVFIVLEANKKGRCLSISRLVVFGVGEEVLSSTGMLYFSKSDEFTNFFSGRVFLMLTLTLRFFFYTFVELCVGRLEPSGIQEDLANCSRSNGLFHDEGTAVSPRTCPCKYPLTLRKQGRHAAKNPSYSLPVLSTSVLTNLL